MGDIKNQRVTLAQQRPRTSFKSLISCPQKLVELFNLAAEIVAQMQNHGFKTGSVRQEMKIKTFFPLMHKWKNSSPKAYLHIITMLKVL